MPKPISLAISSKAISVGSSDVIISDFSLSNALVKNPAAVLVELQKNYGSTVSLDQIDIDHNGAVVINNPALAKEMKSRIADPGLAAHNFCANVSCASKLPGAELIQNDLRLSNFDIAQRLNQIEQRLGG